MDETGIRGPCSGVEPIANQGDRVDAGCDLKIHAARAALVEQCVEDVAGSVRIRKEFAVSLLVERYSQRSKPGNDLRWGKGFQNSADYGWAAAVEITLVDDDIRHVAARSAANQDLGAGSCGRIDKLDREGWVQSPREDRGRKPCGSCTDNGDVADLVYEFNRGASPRRPPLLVRSRPFAPLRSRGFLAALRRAHSAHSRGSARRARSRLSASVLSGRTPPSFTFKSVMDFIPPVVDLVGCWEAFYANGAGRVRNDDFVTRTLGFGSHFTLKRLAAALEEIEHVPDYCTGRATKRLSFWRWILAQNIALPRFSSDRLFDPCFNVTRDGCFFPAASRPPNNWQ